MTRNKSKEKTPKSNNELREAKQNIMHIGQDYQNKMVNKQRDMTDRGQKTHLTQLTGRPDNHIERET